MTTLAQFIKDLRLARELSQEAVAKHLRVSRPTYVQIEQGERELTISEAEKLADFFGISLTHFLARNPQEQEPQVIFQKAAAKHAAKPALRISVPQKNVTKFKEVLLYVLSKVGAWPNVGEVVLYKLLYFIDFNYYEKYEEQLIGATYIKNKFGPTPVEFKKIVHDMIADEELDSVNTKYFTYTQKKYLPIRDPHMEVLNARELQLIDEVLELYGRKSATELSTLSHRDVPWITAEDGKPIDYEAVFYRTPEFSVRRDLDELQDD
jgi:transcriptional regulator with XRE-family HTH domain